MTPWPRRMEMPGALASGAKIYLRGNSVTETGKQVMGNAAKARGLDVIF